MREIVDYGVLGFLLFLSIIVIGIAIERFWFFKKVQVSQFKDKRVLELQLFKRLTLIATIGANAPYIGLLGTIFGIMVTFVEIGNNALLDTQQIMVGLSLALKAIAAGLCLAIPCIVCYNTLTRKAEVILMQWDITYIPQDAHNNKYAV